MIQVFFVQVKQIFIGAKNIVDIFNLFSIIVEKAQKELFNSYPIREIKRWCEIVKMNGDVAVRHNFQNS